MNHEKNKRIEELSMKDIIEIVKFLTNERFNEILDAKIIGNHKQQKKLDYL